MCVFCVATRIHTLVVKLYTWLSACVRVQYLCEWWHTCVSMNTCQDLSVCVRCCMQKYVCVCISTTVCNDVTSVSWPRAHGDDWGCDLLHTSQCSTVRALSVAKCACVLPRWAAWDTDASVRVRWANSPSTHRWETEVDLAVTQVSLTQECHAWFHSIKCEIESEYGGQSVSLRVRIHYLIHIIYW